MDKLSERVKDHTPIDFDAAQVLETSLNEALDDIASTEKQTNKKGEQPLIMDRATLKRFKTDNAITPELGGRLKAHKADYPLREISMERSRGPRT